MTAVRAAVHQTFSSLRIRNYRLYFTAQLISVSGTWMQTVAQAWLVLHLTGSGVALGIVVGLQFLPMLLFGPFGGLVADRMNKRSLLYATQTAGGLLALALGLLVVTDAVQLWQVYLLAALLGVVNVFDNPARQTFVMEMVGRDDLPNAVSLNTVVMNASRVVGPAIGGLVITLVGLGACFFINAASYIAVVVGLSMMRSAELHPTAPVERAKGQIREGFDYVWRTPGLRNTLLAIALIGIFAYNFTVTLALLAKVTFHGGAGTYSLLTSCMGIGAVVGGLIAAHRARPTPRLLQVLALVFGGLLAAVALAPDAGHRLGAHRVHGRGVDRVHRHGQRHAPADVGPGHAGEGHGPLRHGLPRDHAHRGTPGRGHRPVDQSAGGPAQRGGGHRGRRRPADVAAPGRSPEDAGGRRRRRGADPRGPGRAGRRVARGLTGVRHLAQPAATALGSLGRPRTRSPTMLRWISAVPPQIDSERLKKKDACRSLTG